MIPKQHGAWAVLYGPFLVAWMAVGSLQASLWFFLVAFSSLFLAQEPFSRLVRQAPGAGRGDGRRKRIRLWLTGYLAAFAASGALLIFFFHLWQLLSLGAAALVLFSIHQALVKRRQERSLLGEFIGVSGLTLTAPGTHYVLTGELDERAWLVWALNLLFFTSGLFYVKMRVSRLASRPDQEWNLLSCTVYHLVLLSCLFLLVTLELLSPAVILAYVPAVLRAVWGMRVPPGPFNMRRLGYSEVALTVLFVVILPLALRAG